MEVEPSGRPIVSAALSAETASAETGAFKRSAKRPPQRSISGATLTRPSSRPSRCAPALDQRQSSARSTSLPRTGVQRHIARRRHEMLLVHHDRAEARLEEMARHPEPRIDDRRISPVGLAERPARAPPRGRGQG
jgi:hypothetical protein